MNKTRGRRAGSPDTRTAILDVARRRFVEDGYAATTMRGIAAEAEVDAALVSYYFGSKNGLFSAAMTLSISPTEILRGVFTGHRDSIPERLVAAVTRTWDDPEASASLYAALLGILANPAQLPVVREFFEREVIGPLAAELGGDTEARHRAAAVTMTIAGIVVLRGVLAMPTPGALTVGQLQALLGPAIRATLAAPR